MDLEASTTYEGVDFDARLEAYSVANSVSRTVADTVVSNVTYPAVNSVLCTVADTVVSNVTYRGVKSVSYTVNTVMSHVAYTGVNSVANRLSAIDASRLAYLNEVRRYVYARLVDLPETSIRSSESERGFYESRLLLWHSAHDLWQGFVHEQEQERIAARIQALEHFGLASGEQAEWIATEYPAYWATRLEVLLRHEVLRSYFQSILRLVHEQISRILLRRGRILELTNNLFVLQADWYVLHGAHPPRESGRLAFDAISCAGGCPI
jgi:hypothetical protein